MGLFDRFINGWQDPAVDFPIANPANPVNWTGLAQAIVGSFIAGIAAALIEVPNAIGRAYTAFFDGLRNFVAGGEFDPVTDDLGDFVDNSLDPTMGFVDVLFTPFTNAAYGVWSFNVDQFGILALPITTAIVLASLYFVTIGAQRAYRILLGGDAF